MKTQHDTGPNRPTGDSKMTVDEARKLIDEQIAEGLENTPAEIMTAYGLEDEYPQLARKADADAARLSGSAEMKE